MSHPTPSPTPKREPPEGRGADYPSATTEHDRTAVDAGSAAITSPPSTASPGHHPAATVLAKAAGGDTPQSRRPRPPSQTPPWTAPRRPPDQPRNRLVISPVHLAPPLPPPRAWALPARVHRRQGGRRSEEGEEEAAVLWFTTRATQRGGRRGGCHIFFVDAEANVRRVFIW
jgi:hypothetical protein